MGLLRGRARGKGLSVEGHDKSWELAKVLGAQRTFLSLVTDKDSLTKLYLELIFCSKF